MYRKIRERELGEPQKLGRCSRDTQHQHGGQDPVPERTPLLGDTEAQPHPEEGCDQDEVAEVGENPNLAREPSDEREFEREKAERRK